MGKRSKDAYYCDNCGDELIGYGDFYHVATWKVFTSAPVNVDSANAGESAVVCNVCCDELDI